MFTMVVRRKYAWALCLMISTLMFSFSCNKAEEKEEGIESENLTIPVISSVEIRPEKPLSCEDLEAIVKIKGGADEEYKWWKNGNEITGEAGSTLGIECFFKGDSIEVEVIPYRRDVKGQAKRSEPVVILNSPPIIKFAGIEPSPAYSRDDLKAKVDVFDADSDYIRYTFQWEKDNREIPGETGSTFPSSYFKRGDKVRYRVGVSDGESEEVVRHSKTSDILNSPPSIISQSSGKITGESIYEYKVVAEDADGDSLTYRLASAPEGMTINPSSGVIKWNVGEEQKGENHEFKVIVEDEKGALSIQSITLKVTFK